MRLCALAGQRREKPSGCAKGEDTGGTRSTAQRRTMK